ncbi:MAG: hypothetical protein KAW14_01980 [Candidatus Aegiribacteria sp.]|nr:hypothetical protein [Candidatus Aegiribacteria sp.]
MWESLGKFLMYISEGFNARYRWLMIPLILLFLFFIFLVVEHYSGWCYYGNLSKKIAILERLHTLTDKEILYNKHLAPIFNQTVFDISSDQITRFQFIGEASLLWKAISGASVGIFVLIGALAASKKNQKGMAIFGVLCFTVISALVAISIPTLGFPFINYIVVPGTILLALVLLAKLSTRSVAEKAKAVACKSNMRSISTGMKMFNAQYSRLATNLAELSIILSNAHVLMCPSCHKPYQLVVVENDYSVVCPNEPSHGAFNKYSGSQMPAIKRSKKEKKGE